VGKSNKFSRKNGRSNALWVVSGLLVVVFIGGIWFSLGKLPEADNEAEGNTDLSNPAVRINLLTKEINDLQLKLEEDPLNKKLLVALANDQYDLGAIYLFELEQVSEGTGWFDRAVASYQKALQQDPENIEARVDMATAAFYAGQNELARAGYEQAIAQNPAYANARFNYGMFLFHSAGDYQGAIAQWEEVLKLNVDQEMLDHTRSLLEHVRGLVEEQSTGEVKR
jgi:tetratricopeptide (TPR) repeat protein